MSDPKEKLAARKTLADILKVKEENETDSPDYFYNNLYTNQMASSVEPDVDEVASGILKRRRERQQIAEIHGSTPPSNKESALVNLLKVMIDILRIEKQKLDLEKAKRSTGHIEAWNFTISTTPIIHLDFTDGGEHKNLPTDVNINSPGQGFFSVTVWNYSGADVRFNINKESDLLGNAAVVKPGGHITIAYDQPKINKLNIALVQGTGSTADVQIMGVL